jgi:hypothetical protein
MRELAPVLQAAYARALSLTPGYTGMRETPRLVDAFLRCGMIGAEQRAAGEVRERTRLGADVGFQNEVSS